MVCFAVNFTLLYLTWLLKESLQAYVQYDIHNLEFPYRHRLSYWRLTNLSDEYCVGLLIVSVSNFIYLRSSNSSLIAAIKPHAK